MGTNQFDRSGLFVYAENTGGEASTFQGIDFVAHTTNTVPWIHEGFHGSTVTNPISNPGGWHSSPATITLGGGTGEVGGVLTSGATYRVQLLLMDGRNGYDRVVKMNGITMGDYANGDEGATTWGDGLLVAGVFTADSTSQSFQLEAFEANGVSSAGAHLNALVLHRDVARTVTQWNLGESGTLGAGSRPQNSTGTNHFENPYGSGFTVVTDTVHTRTHAALRFDGSSGFYRPSTLDDFIPTNNVAIEMWLRTTNTTQNTDGIFQTADGGHPGRMRFHVTNGNWSASIAGNWIGGENGAGQAITAGEWTHLAVIRENGMSKLYLNGAPRPGTQTTPFQHNSAVHLGIAPFATSFFEGDIDQLRVFTFDPETVDPRHALSINHVLDPPPSGLVFFVH